MIAYSLIIQRFLRFLKLQPIQTWKIKLKTKKQRYRNMKNQTKEKQKPSSIK